MNKVILIVSVVVIALISFVTVFSVASMQNNKSEKEKLALVQKQTEAKEQIDKLTEDKDGNDYLPSDVVKYFLTEVKNGNTDTAKLYVASDKKDKDFNSWLSVQKLDNIGEATYVKTGDTATVTVEIATSDETFTKEIELIQEELVWKISEVKGE